MTGSAKRLRDRSLFHRILGDAWDSLPLPIREFHSANSVSVYRGRCTVTRGGNLLARAITALAGFPTGGEDLPIAVRLSVEMPGERWVRTVADRTFSSSLTSPAERSAGLIRERLGPIAMDMALVADASRLTYVLRGWRLLNVPLPIRLGPTLTAAEFVDAGGRFNFDIRLEHPFTGVLVRYAGWLTNAHADSEITQSSRVDHRTISASATPRRTG